MDGLSYQPRSPFHTTAPSYPTSARKLFIDIAQLYINPFSPRRDLIRLTLVCQRWRMIVEGAPSLWCRIRNFGGSLYETRIGEVVFVSNLTRRTRIPGHWLRISLTG